MLTYKVICWSYLALLADSCRLALGIKSGCVFQHPLSGIVAAIQQDILHHLQQLLVDLLVDIRLYLQERQRFVCCHSLYSVLLVCKKAYAVKEINVTARCKLSTRLKITSHLRKVENSCIGTHEAFG